MTNFNEYNDQDLFDLFSDWYKEVNGVRPGRRSREDIISWMDYESDPAVQDQRRVEWEREAAWLDELDARLEEDQTEFEQTCYEEYDYLEEVL